MGGVKRYDAQRDLNEPAIVEGLRKLGCSVVLIDEPCDLVVGSRKRNFLLEVKNLDGRGRRKTDNQLDFHATWRGQIDIVESLEEAVEVVFGPSAVQGGTS